MNKVSQLILAPVMAAAFVVAGSAAAHPGGGGGMGGGFGGGMGMGGGIGPGGMGGTMHTDMRSMHANGGAGVSTHTSTSTLNNNTHLSTSLTNALGHSGVTVPSGGLQAACSGFRNLGSCVAALHVSHNLSLPGGFTGLKTLMTGSDHLSLGAAVQRLDPQVNAKAAAHTGQRQAETDLDAADRENSDG